MKKKYLIPCFLLITLLTFSQQSNVTFTQNVNSSDITGGSAICWFLDEDDEFYGDFENNIFARSFDLTGDHNIDEDFIVSSVEIGVRNGSDIVGTINLYYADSRDLSDSENELTLVESKDVTFFEFANNTVLVVGGWNALIPAGKSLVVEVDVPENQHASETGATEIADFKLFTFGRNDEGEIHHAWIKAPACGVDNYIDLNIISSNPQHIVINVTGQETMSIQKEKFSQIEIYPNPVKNQLSVDVPSDMQIKSTHLIDLNGKRLPVSLVDGILDMSAYASGNYLLELNTSFGKTTRKIIKQ